MKILKSTITLIFFSTIAFAQFSQKEKQVMNAAIIRDYEQMFILDDFGRNILAECTLNRMESHFRKSGKPSVDTINVWYSESRLFCIAEHKSQLVNCYSRWSAFPPMSESTVIMFESFVPVLKKVRPEDKSLLIGEILSVLKANYPAGFPFVVPPNKLKSMLMQIEVVAKRNQKLRKYF